MSYVRIVSKRKGGTQARPGEKVVAVDRSNPVLGNRHVLRDHTDAAKRAEVIAAHAADEASDFERNGPMSKTLRQLATEVEAGQPLALECYCAPKPCHAETYRARIASILGRDVTPPDERRDAKAPSADTQGTLF